MVKQSTINKINDTRIELTQNDLDELKKTVEFLVMVQFQNKRISVTKQDIEDVAATIIHELFTQDRDFVSVKLLEIRAKSRVIDFIRDRKLKKRIQKDILESFSNNQVSPEIPEVEAREICLSYKWKNEEKCRVKYDSDSQVIDAVSDLYGSSNKKETFVRPMSTKEILKQFPNVTKDWLYQKMKSNKIKKKKEEGRYVIEGIDVIREIEIENKRRLAA